MPLRQYRELGNVTQKLHTRVDAISLNITPRNILSIKSVLSEPAKPFITISKVLWIIDLLGEIGTFHDS